MDELAMMIGAKPNILKWVFKDPGFAWTLWTQPVR